MSFFEIGQECMPLVAPPAQLADRITTYRQALDYLMLEKARKTTYPTAICYRYLVDLTKGGAAATDADLTPVEKAYRKVFLPCDSTVSVRRLDELDVAFLGLEDPSYTGYPLLSLTIEPLPHAMAEWTAYIPLILYLPTLIRFCPVDEASLDAALSDFISDSSGVEAVRDPDHRNRFYKQYLRSMKSAGNPLPITDPAWVAGLLSKFKNWEFPLILRGGTPLGEILPHAALKYNLNIVLESYKRALTEAETDAFFTYRQRMPGEHKKQYGVLAGHPASALVLALEQAAQGESAAVARARAKLLSEAGLVDFLRIDQDYDHSKYGQFALSGDHVDYDYHPNVMFLRAKQRPADLEQFAGLAAIDPWEYISGTNFYDPDNLPIYFDFPHSVIEVGENVQLPNITQPLTVTTLNGQPQGFMMVKSLVDAEQRVEILLRHTDANGPIIKRLWVQILEPRFIDTRIHEIRGGDFDRHQVSGGGAYTYPADISFTLAHQADASKLQAVLDFWNLKGPGYEETYSRYGNIFIVNKTTPNYVCSVPEATLSITDGVSESVGEVEFPGIEYLHEVTSGQPTSVLMVAGLTDSPIDVVGSMSLDPLFSWEVMQLVSFHDHAVFLSVHLTWDLGSMSFFGGEVLGLAVPRTPLSLVWHASKGRTVLLSTWAASEFLAAVLFHETCHRVAIYFGAGFGESAPITYTDDVARLVHPMFWVLHGEIDFSVQWENYTYPLDLLKVNEGGMSMLLETSAYGEASREQFFPGNIMGPDAGASLYPSDMHAGDYKPAVHPRLTYNQVMSLNHWLR